MPTGEMTRIDTGFAASSLLAERPLMPDERTAHDDEPRPGVWTGEQGADLRALTQDETDIVIREELWTAASVAERGELERAIGGPPRGVFIEDHPDRTRVRTQRGGIDSDPLVRLLAYRAWGDRDRRWFEQRGVRKGEPVTRLASSYTSARDGAWSQTAIVARAWTNEDVVGIAEHDARPGETIQLDTTAGHAATGRVGDRLRGDPLAERIALFDGPLEDEQALLAEFGFDRLGMSHEPQRLEMTLTAERSGHRVRCVISRNVSGSADVRAAMLRARCAALDRELTRMGAPRR